MFGPCTPDPSQAFQRGCYPALFASAELGRVDEQRFPRDLQDGGLGGLIQVVADLVLPGVRLVASLLLGCDVLVLKFSGRPPARLPYGSASPPPAISVQDKISSLALETTFLATL